MPGPESWKPPRRPCALGLYHDPQSHERRDGLAGIVLLRKNRSQEPLNPKANAREENRYRINRLNSDNHTRRTAGRGCLS